MAVLLALVVVLRLRRRVEARSRSDEKLTVVLVLLLGLLLAPTDLGQGLVRVLRELVESVSSVQM